MPPTNNPLPSRRIHYEPEATPVERIRAARREFDWHLWFLKRHLALLQKQMKEAGKMPAGDRKRWQASSLEAAIEETKGLVIQRGAAIFRELGEIRLAVVSHQNEGDEEERSRILPGV